MPDDLFGPHNAAWDRFAAVTPKRKPSRFVPVKVLSVPEEMAEKIRQQRAQDYYGWAVEELERWRGRLPSGEWHRLKAKVEALKP
jgi:hypothetical protein